MVLEVAAEVAHHFCHDDRSLAAMAQVALHEHRFLCIGQAYLFFFMV
jgi:hypothetical protein